MGVKRSGKRQDLNLEIYGKFFIGFVLICTARIAVGVTNPSDVHGALNLITGIVLIELVTAINSLYISLGSPLLPGWVSIGGDPCGEAWQGIVCNASEIQSIILNGANLGGELGDNLGMFASIRSIDLSNNHIGGSIPSNLPVTMLTFFLADNNFTGSIPDSLSSLTLLNDMSLNDNFLSGEIPDVFQSLPGLINLDLSNNNLSGQLPSSFVDLASLTTLNIENNLFSGPIPDKLLAIPNFSGLVEDVDNDLWISIAVLLPEYEQSNEVSLKTIRKDGNPFNSSTSPVPAPTSLPASTPPPPPPPTPTTPFWGPPSPSSRKAPGKQADGPSSAAELNSGGKKFLTTKRLVWICIAGVLLFAILALALALLIPKCSRRRKEASRISKRHQVVPKETLQQPKEDHPKPQNVHKRNEPKMDLTLKRDDHLIDMSRLDTDFMPPPPPPPPPPPTPPPPPPPVENVIVKPYVPPAVSSGKPSRKTQTTLTSAKSFTIASLQQYTNSFSQENFIGGGMLGSVYRAQLPNGKLLAVKKLDKRTAEQQKENEFIELVNNIDQIRHANVVELMGYCAEHGQRLLIYEYCSGGSLQDALHSDDEFKRKLSWNARVRMALGAARALEYLHEVCQPPVIHRNFKSANLLLDDDLDVRVSDCGLASLISSGAVSQLSGQLLTAYGYGAPEFESGIYTVQSDVYSFGVVMLELLTGRKSHDRTRNRGEQFLVRWAIPQLHDINTLSKMVDPSLNGEYSAKSLSHFADIISRCVQSGPEFRPPMSEVVQDLSDMIRRDRPSKESIDS
ncbi:hypothetical protein DKX38_029826 [Salix brachista]|uniref:Protein kinase domain-containing protein n=1 Tax=Salix brachista TaxID=2182728 RepID=A0A5N5J052_9ROSI|nr:hypothetical protein DKX38_029826 [Salix brachista]